MIDAPTGDYGAGGISNGSRLRRVKPGDLLGGGHANELIKAVEALLYWRVGTTDAPVGKITISDSGVILDLPSGNGNGPPVSISWKGEYSGSTDYAAGDLVHVTSGTSISFYLCLVANGPSTSVQAPSPGAATTYWDCYANGGGGGAQRMQIQAGGVNGDFLVCQTWDGTTLGGTNLYVAKPVELRHSTIVFSGSGTASKWNSSAPGAPSPSVNNMSVTYLSDVNLPDGTRSVASTAAPPAFLTQSEMADPPYMDITAATAAGQPSLAEIWADQPAGGTGATRIVLGLAVPVPWMDTNRGGRAWVQTGIFT